MDPFTLVLLFMLGFAVLMVAGLGNKRRTGLLLPRIVSGGAMVFAMLSAVAGTLAGQRANEQLFDIRDSALAGGVNVPPGWTLDELLAERGMTLTRLSELVGVSIVNLSVLKND